MQSLFADPRVIANLKDLHAGLGVAIVDFTPERAELVRRLNRDGIPVIAGLGMPPEQGSYFNAENAPEAAARFAAFDAWSREQGLRWDGVGSDIEPNFAELASLNEPPVAIVYHALVARRRRSAHAPRTASVFRAYRQHPIPGLLRANLSIAVPPCRTRGPLVFTGPDVGHSRRSR